MFIKIVKNKRVVDAENCFTYVVECHHGDIVDKTKVKIPANDYMLPDESVTNITNDALLLKKWLEQLNYEYDDIEIDNYTITIEEIV